MYSIHFLTVPRYLLHLLSLLPPLPCTVRSTHSVGAPYYCFHFPSRFHALTRVQALIWKTPTVSGGSPRPNLKALLSPRSPLEAIHFGFDVFHFFDLPLPRPPVIIEPCPPFRLLRSPMIARRTTYSVRSTLGRILYTSLAR